MASFGDASQPTDCIVDMRGLVGVAYRPVCIMALLEDRAGAGREWER